ncbi:MAG: Undecaprenyl phosphate-alpha-4-amino-4-deoxy-L-arabinose arabinosyl transferase [Bacteroidota bacterium]
MKTKFDFHFWLIFGIAAVLYIPFNGAVDLFDWDEINFAESAREMIVSGDYTTVTINFKAFWEKPPLFIWMQVLSMKLFGINAFAARFPNAIAGVVTLLTLFSLGRKMYGLRFGYFWSLLQGFSFLPFLYFKSGIIDPWFNYFIFLGIYQFIVAYQGEVNKKRMVLSAVFIGLATLTKGPVALLLFGLTVVITLLIKKNWKLFQVLPILIWLLSFMLVGGSWFFYLFLSGNKQVIIDFIVYQIRLFQTEDAGHGGFFLYHFVVYFFAVFPAMWWALPQLFSRAKNNTLVLSMQVLFWVVLILFTIVQTKIVHYSSMAYFAVSFLGAIQLLEWQENRKEWRGIYYYGWMTVQLIWIILLIVLPIFWSKKELWKSLIKDEMAKDNLEAIIHFPIWGIAFAVVLLFLFGMVHYYKNRNPNRAMISMFSLSVLTFVCWVVIIPIRVSPITQRSAIIMCEFAVNNNLIIQNVGYKSYAPLFYGERKFLFEKDDEWLTQNNPDGKIVLLFKKPHFIEVAKTHSKLRILAEKNGFVLAYTKINQ